MLTQEENFKLTTVIDSQLVPLLATFTQENSTEGFKNQSAFAEVSTFFFKLLQEKGPPVWKENFEILLKIYEEKSLAERSSLLKFLTSLFISTLDKLFLVPKEESLISSESIPSFFENFSEIIELIKSSANHNEKTLEEFEKCQETFLTFKEIYENSPLNKPSEFFLKNAAHDLRAHKLEDLKEKCLSFWNASSPLSIEARLSILYMFIGTSLTSVYQAFDHYKEKIEEIKQLFIGILESLLKDLSSLPNYDSLQEKIANFRDDCSQIRWDEKENLFYAFIETSSLRREKEVMKKFFSYGCHFNNCYYFLSAEKLQEIENETKKISPFQLVPLTLAYSYFLSPISHKVVIQFNLDYLESFNNYLLKKASNTNIPTDHFILPEPLTVRKEETFFNYFLLPLTPQQSNELLEKINKNPRTAIIYPIEYYPFHSQCEHLYKQIFSNLIAITNGLSAENASREKFFGGKSYYIQIITDSLTLLKKHTLSEELPIWENLILEYYQKLVQPNNKAFLFNLIQTIALEVFERLNEELHGKNKKIILDNFIPMLETLIHFLENEEKLYLERAELLLKRDIIHSFYNDDLFTDKKEINRKIRMLNKKFHELLEALAKEKNDTEKEELFLITLKNIKYRVEHPKAETHYFSPLKESFQSWWKSISSSKEAIQILPIFYKLIGNCLYITSHFDDVPKGEIIYRRYQELIEIVLKNTPSSLTTEKYIALFKRLSHDAENIGFSADKSKFKAILPSEMLQERNIKTSSNAISQFFEGPEIIENGHIIRYTISTEEYEKNTAENSFVLVHYVPLFKVLIPNKKEIEIEFFSLSLRPLLQAVKQRFDVKTNETCIIFPRLKLKNESGREKTYEPEIRLNQKELGTIEKFLKNNSFFRKRYHECENILRACNASILLKDENIDGWYKSLFETFNNLEIRTFPEKSSEEKKSERLEKLKIFLLELVNSITLSIEFVAEKEINVFKEKCESLITHIIKQVNEVEELKDVKVMMTELLECVKKIDNNPNNLQGIYPTPYGAIGQPSEDKWGPHIGNTKYIISEKSRNELQEAAEHKKQFIVVNYLPSLSLKETNFQETKNKEFEKKLEKIDYDAVIAESNLFQTFTALLEKDLLLEEKEEQKEGEIVDSDEYKNSLLNIKSAIKKNQERNLINAFCVFWSARKQTNSTDTLSRLNIIYNMVGYSLTEFCKNFDKKEPIKIDLVKNLFSELISTILKEFSEKFEVLEESLVDLLKRLEKDCTQIKFNDKENIFYGLLDLYEFSEKDFKNSPEERFYWGVHYKKTCYAIPAELQDTLQKDPYGRFILIGYKPAFSYPDISKNIKIRLFLDYLKEYSAYIHRISNHSHSSQVFIPKELFIEGESNISLTLKSQNQLNFTATNKYLIVEYTQHKKEDESKKEEIKNSLKHQKETRREEKERQRKEKKEKELLLKQEEENKNMLEMASQNEALKGLLSEIKSTEISSSTSVFQKLKNIIFSLKNLKNKMNGKFEESLLKEAEKLIEKIESKERIDQEILDKKESQINEMKKTNKELKKLISKINKCSEFSSSHALFEKLGSLIKNLTRLKETMNGTFNETPLQEALNLHQRTELRDSTMRLFNFLKSPELNSSKENDFKILKERHKDLLETLTKFKIRDIDFSVSPCEKISKNTIQEDPVTAALFLVSVSYKVIEKILLNDKKANFKEESSEKTTQSRKI